MTNLIKLILGILIAGNNFNERNEQIDTKSNQWFGATVSSAGIDGPLVVSLIRNKIINFIALLGVAMNCLIFHGSFNVNSVSNSISSNHFLPPTRFFLRRTLLTMVSFSIINLNEKRR